MQKPSSSLPFLLLIGVAHCLNDSLQSLVMACYPMIKAQLQLNYAQIGLITLSYQISASLLQPCCGYFFDRYPSRHSLFFWVLTATAGLVLLATAQSLGMILLAVVLFGIGSSIFHPEGSRLTHLASQGRRSSAQAIFQVGGNAGTAVGPLFVALVLTTRLDLLYALLLCALGLWLAIRARRWQKKAASQQHAAPRVLHNPFPPARTVLAVTTLVLLLFSKYAYIESMRSYYTFYLIDRYDVSVSSAQLALFVFLIGGAVGTLCGGLIGDRIGRERLIWISILGAAPFAYASLYTGVYGSVLLSCVAGFIIASAFPSIIVYAQELLPRRLSLVSGLFFGIAFGISGLCSGMIGYCIDLYGIERVYAWSLLTPLLGVIAILLPRIPRSTERE